MSNACLFHAPLFKDKQQTDSQLRMCPADLEPNCLANLSNRIVSHSHFNSSSLHNSSTVTLSVLSSFFVSQIHSELGSRNLELWPHLHSNLSLAVGDKVRMWRQVVPTVSGHQLVHLLYGGPLFLGAVSVPVAQCLCRIPALQHAGVGNGVGAKIQRVGAVDPGAFGLVSVLLLAGQLGAVWVGGLLLQAHRV